MNRNTAINNYQNLLHEIDLNKKEIDATQRAIDLGRTKMVTLMESAGKLERQRDTAKLDLDTALLTPETRTRGERTYVFPHKPLDFANRLVGAAYEVPKVDRLDITQVGTPLAYVPSEATPNPGVLASIWSTLRPRRAGRAI